MLQIEVYCTQLQELSEDDTDRHFLSRNDGLYRTTFGFHKTYIILGRCLNEFDNRQNCSNRSDALKQLFCYPVRLQLVRN